MILPAWFDHLEESLSKTEVQFEKFCLPVKLSNAFEQTMPYNIP